MGINMSYCMFENTVKAMDEIKEKMWEEGFDPNTLSTHERRAYDELHELCSSITSALEEIEEKQYNDEIALRLEEEDEEAKPYDPNYGDHRICTCGHEYHRHFDSYENMDPVGCKYCGCYSFEEKLDTK